MARYAYDVNTTQRLIDVHKQFQGGLKTVDTDDSLGAVFLRQAENVSLSEFGFLEKRYGTYENFKKQFSGNLQGYWEFQGHIIFVVDGTFYVDGNEVQYFYKENTEWRYPDNLLEEVIACEFVDGNSVVVEQVQDPTEEPVACTQGASYYSNCTIRTCSSCENTWECIPTTAVTEQVYTAELQTTRDMNAVNVNSVLYIFTGTYPIYVKIVEGQPKFYVFSIDIPTYDEIVVVGHNLLEDDYEGLYFPETFKDLSTPGLDTNQVEKVAIDDADFIPKIPYAAEDDKIDLKLSYKYNSGLGTFDYQNPFTLPDGNTFYDKYYQLKLDRVDYRNSGAGASTLDYLTFLEDSVTHSNNLDNLGTGQPTPDLPFEGFLYNKILLTSQEFDQSAGGGADSTYYHAYTTEITERIPKEGLKPNDVFNLEFFKSTSNPNNPWESILFSDFHNNPSNYGPSSKNNVITLEITPYDSNDNLFEAGKISIPTSEIDTSNDSYKFVIPSTISTSDFVFGYQLYFKHTIVDDVITVGASYTYSYEDFSRSLSRVLKTDTFDQFLDHNFLTITLTNLLSGTYDIRPVYVLEEYNYTGSGFELNNTTEINYTFSKITITPEQLQDFPRKDEDSIGIEYPSLKPIWTCNKVLEHFGKLMVWGSIEMPTAVFYSFPDRPTFFPSKFYLDFTNDDNSPVQAVTPYMNILVVQTEEQTWGVRGNSGLIDAPSPYIPFMINPTVGTIAYKSVRPVRNHLFFLSKQGIIALKSLYAADEQYNIDFMDRNIFNIVPRDIKAVGLQFDNQYWLNFPNFGITLRWYIDKKAWVLDTYHAWNDFKGVFKYQIKDGKLEFITYPSLFKDSNNHIYKVGIDYSLPTDLGAIVVAKFETSFLNQNYPFHPKNYKEAKLDFTLQNEYNLSKDVIYFEDNIEIDQSHFLDNVPLLKNHRYRINYYNLPKDLDLSYTVNIYPKFYIEDGIIGNQGVPLLTSYSGTLTTPDVDPKEGTQEHIAFIEFLMPNALDGNYDIEIVLDTYLDEIDTDVRDSTYDDALNFLIWLTSENSTLNQDPIRDYEQAKVNIGISLQDRLGDWEFGQTDFGKKITAVETIKLSGKGYNVKMYMEDYSKSKWTLESLGLTYKMKRARSR
jgi:hypothetical protein